MFVAVRQCTDSILQNGKFNCMFLPKNLFNRWIKASFQLQKEYIEKVFKEILVVLNAAEDEDQRG